MAAISTCMGRPASPFTLRYVAFPPTVIYRWTVSAAILALACTRECSAMFWLGVLLPCSVVGLRFSLCCLHTSGANMPATRNLYFTRIDSIQ